MAKYVFDVGVFDKNGTEIGEEFIAAKNEKEMWKIFDKDYRCDYPDYHTAAIYDCNLA